MEHAKLTKIWVVLLCLLVALPVAGQDKVLWQIGKADNNTAEFAIGPDGSNQYSVRFPHDVVFVAGQSDPKQDWSYIQPGPADVWAGSKSHTFTIVFGVKNVPSEGTCELVIDYVDTHSSRPPKVEIHVNDQAFVRDLPKGAGDASAFGQPEKGREHVMAVEFPANLLREGTNDLRITSATGSWVLYDYVMLKVPGAIETDPVDGTDKLIDVYGQPFLVKGKDGRLYQPVLASVLHIGEPVEAAVVADVLEPVSQTLQSGFKVIEGLAPEVDEARTIAVDVQVAGKSIGGRSVTIEPVRKWEVWLLHHSHVDIGYTHVQTEVVQKHWDYYEQVIELARKTADYPEGSQFKWNVEVLWAVDSYLKRASKEKRGEFIEAIRKGWIALDALYGNELTALCRPEELIRLVGYAEELRKLCGVEVDSAMITDVPGYTWGIVPVLAQSGVKYFSVGPNRGHRIGYTLSEWGDKPFYWEGPSGKEKILCWVAGEGYSLFHAGRLDSGRLFEYLKRLEKSEYPYDMVQIRYSIGGDNGPPDPGLSDFVRDWNAKYAYPKIIVTTASEMCRQFERRYGEKLPTVRGDFTPYWEDGAGSSARETALNRAATERLVQAEALWAMLNPRHYPAERFYEAWRNVILYDEHTWGSWNSISDPEGDFTKNQWRIKQAFAVDAAIQSRELFDDALTKYRSPAEKVTAVDVFNTCSWPRTDLVMIPAHWQLTGNIVFRYEGGAVPSGRLPTGEIAFLAADIPALGSKRFTLESPAQMQMFMPPAAEATPPTVRNSFVTVTLDEKTGAISSIKHRDIPVDLVANDTGVGVNDYLYVEGRDPREPLRNGPVKISVKDYGSMMASLLIESDAPGCNKLIREVRLIRGLDRVDIIDTIDKEKIYKQEAVHLGFAFNVAKGVVRMDVPWGVVRPELDQLAGACKNYFTVQQWIDVSNDKFGVTLATVDAPLIEIGRITCDPVAVGWLRRIEPSTTLYSYVMNNYWETNYKAAQEGPTTFRYSIWPHQKFDAAKAARFGAERSQPLIIVPVSKKRREVKPIIAGIKPESVVATAFKPSEDGKARIVRLFNVGCEAVRAEIVWAKGAPKTLWLSSLAEEEVSKVTERIDMAAYEIVTLRIPGTE